MVRLHWSNDRSCFSLLRRRLEMLAAAAGPRSARNGGTRKQSVLGRVGAALSRRVTLSGHYGGKPIFDSDGLHATTQVPFAGHHG